ncbi:MAG: hypothetical protein LBU60_03660 [Clostridiales bacterium]|nr:hypothetical protein [Clostridiales bacterium]
MKLEKPHVRVEQDRGMISSLEAQKRDTDMARRKSNDWLTQMPLIPKAAFIKFWFAGAIYFFFGWSIMFYGYDSLDMMVIIGVVIGVLVDLIANRILIGIDDARQKMPRYLMFCKRKLYYMFFNILYSIFLCLGVAGFYAIMNIKSKTEIGVEPILFGVIYTILDFICLFVRNFAVDKLLSRR